MNESGLKLNQDFNLLFNNDDYKNTKFFMNDKLSVTDFFNQNIKSIDENLEKIEHLSEKEICQEKKAELLKTKNNIQEFIKNKLTNSNFYDRHISTNTLSTSQISNIKLENNRNNSGQNVTPFEMRLLQTTNKGNKPHKKKPSSSKELLQLNNELNLNKVNIPLSNGREKNIEFTIEECLIKTKKRSNSNEQNEDINNENSFDEIDNYFDNSIKDKDKPTNNLGIEEEDNESGEEYSYDEDNVHEININNNSCNEDTIFSKHSENEVIDQRNSKTSENNESLRKELTSEIDTWKMKGEQNRIKIIKVIGEDNFNQILDFYIEKTNVFFIIKKLT